jgi:hypothetical protein
MKRLCVCAGALFFCLGCSSDGDKDQWDAFKKDLRGDNMQMRNDFSGLNGTDDHPVQMKSRD